MSSKDHPISNKQLQLAAWLAARKRIVFPVSIKDSYIQWWRWINSTLTKIDREDAYAASKDFDLDFDPTDPIDVIAKLKYATVADHSTELDKAKHAISKGMHPYTAEDIYRLTESELHTIVQDLEINPPAPEFEINWGSV